MSQEFYQNNVKKIVILFKYLKKNRGKIQTFKVIPFLKLTSKLKLSTIFGTKIQYSIAMCNVVHK